MRRVTISLIALALTMVQPVSAQDEATSFDEYTAMIGGWVREFQDRELGLTFESIISYYGQGATRGEGRIASLRSLTPEDCYATANEEIISYYGSSVAESRAVVELARNSESTLDVFPEIVEATFRLAERHPTAFIETGRPRVGFETGLRFDLFNVLRELATCDGAADLVTPEPPFAPDDLAATLPSSIGSIELIVQDDADRAEDAPVASSTMLERFGKDEADFRSAFGVGRSTDGSAFVGIMALRLEGVSGADLTRPFLQELQGDEATIYREETTEQRVLDGKAYERSGPDDTGALMGVYPKGEVLYLVFVGGVTVEDVIAELP